MSSLPDKVRLEVYDALFEYVETGVEPQLSDTAHAAFVFVRADIDEEVTKAIARCDKMRENVIKRWRKQETPKQPAIAFDEQDKQQ